MQRVLLLAIRGKCAEILQWKVREKIAGTEYPKNYRTGVKDEVIRNSTDSNGIVRDVFGNPIDPKTATIEHKRSVVDHWNNEGYNQTAKQRADFYNDTSNMGLMTRKDASRQGGGTKDRYRQDTGPNYKPEEKEAE